ncbi:hypothetical protein RI129_010593 [Pyrocoelia pectoralis]|uniref:Glutathione peroxidase n=1 Tax=Pyrocoelia pectoralis TaxID=417401 RepID=A0AAN7ZDS1_9COLE
MTIAMFRKSALLGLTTAALFAGLRTVMASSHEVNWKDAKSIYDFTANKIDGEPVSLDKYKGHVAIIVNVASQCGYTKNHYEELGELYEQYAESKGLRILGFPCKPIRRPRTGRLRNYLQLRTYP